LAKLQEFDTRLFARLFRQGEHSRLLRPFAKVISRSGDGYLQLLFPLLVWTAGSTLLPDYCMLLGVAMMTERVVYFVLKNGLKRRRPQDFVPGFRSIIQASDQFSFPSGHTSAAFCLATTTGIIFGGPFVVLYLWASLVAASRVVLGVHFPGDTVAGALTGSGIAVATAHQLGIL
jgi:undecaprenyl-diphosphatase